MRQFGALNRCLRENAMIYHYDLHIHSALSPCAENDMTPVSVVGQAKLSGLDFVAVADHNAIGHVPLAIRAGEEFGICVVPAVEVQTREDIHLLCLFRTYDALAAFFEGIPVSQRRNRVELFGDQLYFDEDDNIIGTEPRMLLDSADISCDAVFSRAWDFGGIAIPAHIDRDANSMLKILGDVPSLYPTVELSTRATEEELAFWRGRARVIVDSDSHVAETISADGTIELDEYSVAALIDALRRGRTE